MIMERNLEFENNPGKFRDEWIPKEEALSKKIERARELVREVRYHSRDLLTIASLTASLNVDGHRPDMVILKAARAQAAFDGRTKISDLDIALAAELTLPHRLKRGPFQQEVMTIEELQERIDQLQGQSISDDQAELSPVLDETDGVKKKII